jgi:hypothetical protein
LEPEDREHLAILLPVDFPASLRLLAFLLLLPAVAVAAVLLRLRVRNMAVQVAGAVARHLAALGLPASATTADRDKPTLVVAAAVRVLRVLTLSAQLPVLAVPV